MPKRILPRRQGSAPDALGHNQEQEMARTILVKGSEMSLCLVQSRALLGLEAAEVTVEVHLANGLPSFTLVGLVDVEVKEAR